MTIKKAIAALLTIMLLIGGMYPKTIFAKDEKQEGLWILTPEVPWSVKRAARNTELDYYVRTHGYSADAVDAVQNSMYVDFQDGIDFVRGTYYNGFEPELVCQPFAVYGSEEEAYVYLFKRTGNSGQFHSIEMYSAGYPKDDIAKHNPYGISTDSQFLSLSTTRDDPFLIYNTEAGVTAISLSGKRMGNIVINKDYTGIEALERAVLLHNEREKEIQEGEEVILATEYLTREDITAPLYRIPEKTNDSLNAQLKKEGYKLGELTFGSLELGGYEVRKTYAIGENKLVIQVKAHESDDGWQFDPRAYAVMGNYASHKKIEPGMTISELKKWAKQHLADVVWAMEILGLEKLP